ncbi:hypothetical protein AAMO2058_001424400 [Amorphochlora amoebiformis]
MAPGSSGYAKLLGPEIDHVLKSPHVLLGSCLPDPASADAPVPVLSIGQDPGISDPHLDLNYNFHLRQFELLCIGIEGVCVNGKPFRSGDPPIPLKSQDMISIPGTSCEFSFLLPRQVDLSTDNHSTAGNAVSSKESSLQAFRTDDVSPMDGSRGPSPTSRKRRHAPANWTSSERERFQRVLLTYGFPRADLIKKIANLQQHSEEEIESYTCSFILELAKHLSGDENAYLLRVIRESKSAPSEVHPSLVGWEKMKRSASVWGRRLCNLHFLGELARGEGDLLSHIPSSFFSGPKPTAWWGRNDDKGLLKGTYDHGYARYDHIKADTTLGFTSAETKATATHKPGSAATTNGWPSADVLTRRLKRLIDVSRKNWRKKRPAHHRKCGAAGTAGEIKRSQLKYKRQCLPKMTDAKAHSYIRSLQRKVTGRVWSSAERRLMSRALMKHPIHIDASGRPLMAQIKATAGLGTCDDNDVAGLAYSILWELCLFLSDQNKKRSFEGGPLYLPALNWDKRELRSLADRVPILSRIAKSVNHPHLESTLAAHAPQKTEMLPTWWVRVKHDILLLKGVTKHGYDSWNAIMEDPDLGWGEGDDMGTTLMLDTNHEADMDIEDGVSTYVFAKKPLPESKNIEKKSISLAKFQASSLPSAPSSAALVARLNQLLPVLNLLHTGAPTGSIAGQGGMSAKKETKVVTSVTRDSSLPADTVDSFLVYPTMGDALPDSSVHELRASKGGGWNQGYALCENVPTRFCVPNTQNAKQRVRRTRNPVSLVYRDPNGSPHLPMRIAEDLCLYAIGTPPLAHEMNAYHTQDYIFFPGYKAVREHQSMVNPDHVCKYKCEVVRGEKGPLFRLTCEDSPGETITKKDADEAWQEVANAIFLVSNAPLSDRKMKLNGYERFGLCDESVVAILQETIGHLKCGKYEPIAVAVNNFVH